MGGNHLLSGNVTVENSLGVIIALAVETKGAMSRTLEVLGE